MPKKQRRPRRILWRIFRTLLVICLLCVGLAILYARALTLYIIRKALPDADVRIESVEIHGLTGVVAGNVSIWDKSGKRQLMSADAIRINYRLWNLTKRHLEGVKVTNLNVLIGPDFAEVLPTTSDTGEKSHRAGWSIGQFSCPYAQFFIAGMEGVPTISGKLYFEWTDVRFGNDSVERRLTLWDLTAVMPDARPPDLLNVYLLLVDFKLDDISKRKLARVDLQGGRLVIGEALNRLAAANDSGKGAPPDNNGWMIHDLQIQDIESRIANLPGNAPDMRFSLAMHLTDVNLQGAASELQTREHEIEIADFNIYSPRDPSRKVVSLRSVFIGFTIADLLNQQIAWIKIVRPTIYVSEDLFWYMNQAQQEQETETSDEATGGWKVRNFTAYFGRLVLAAGNHEQVGLPLNFETAVQNVDIGNLASLRLRATLSVPKQDIDLPDYEIEMENLSGDLRFAYPQEKGVNNLVNVLRLGELRWKQFKGRELWLSVTFDLSGVHGEFGGHAYRGYLNGGFDFFFQEGSPWTGWLSGTAMDCGRITDLLAPNNFRMTGPITFLVQVNGRARDIERVHGDYRMVAPGSVHINRLNALLENIPDQWSALKKSAARIGLEVLKDFEFEKAGGDFWFAGGRGRGNLRLSGEAGSRNFDIILHP